jgi:tartrate dehydratase alpha subunit/fumarate hydratase class I-like protein
LAVSYEEIKIHFWEYVYLSGLAWCSPYEEAFSIAGFLRISAKLSRVELKKRKGKSMKVSKEKTILKEFAEGSSSSQIRECPVSHC